MNHVSILSPFDFFSFISLFYPSIHTADLNLIKYSLHLFLVLFVDLRLLSLFALSLVISQLLNHLLGRRYLSLDLISLSSQDAVDLDCRALAISCNCFLDENVIFHPHCSQVKTIAARGGGKICKFDLNLQSILTALKDTLYPHIHFLEKVGNSSRLSQYKRFTARRTTVTINNLREVFTLLVNKRIG